MSQPPATTGRQPSTRRVLGVVALALMTVVSAVSGLNVALPDLARSTGATQTQLTWIVDCLHRRVRRPVALRRRARRPVRPTPPPGRRPGRLRDRRGDRHGHRGPPGAHRPARGDGVGCRRDHADDAVDHHDVVSRRRAAAGHRCLGRRRRWRCRPGPLRDRPPAGVLRLELVLRPQRGPGPGSARGHAGRRPRLGRRAPASARHRGRAALPRRRRRHRHEHHRGPRARLGRHPHGVDPGDRRRGHTDVRRVGAASGRPAAGPAACSPSAASARAAWPSRSSSSRRSGCSSRSCSTSSSWSATRRSRPHSRCCHCRW